MQCCNTGDGAAAEGDEYARIDCRDKNSLLSIKAFITRVMQSRKCAFMHYLYDTDTLTDAMENIIHSQVVQSTSCGTVFQTMNSIRRASLTGITGGFAAAFHVDHLRPKSKRIGSHFVNSIHSK